LILIGYASAAGCSTYTIHGNVIAGAVGEMTFVGPNDSRLREPPLVNARISVQRDPEKLSRHMVGTDLTDAHGRFVITLDEFGAGWMDEQWLIRATKPGYKTMSAMYELTSDKKKKRLVIIMAPGLSQVPPEDEDLLEQYEQFQQQK
jgi:hypothetical protein